MSRARVALCRRARSWGVLPSIAVLAVLALAASTGAPALAQPGNAGAARTPIKGSVIERAARQAVTIDWTRGLLIATGAATGDLRAPSPAIARVSALRNARQQARDRLLARARALTLGDAAIAERADGDEEIAARLQKALESTLELSVDYGSDGSIVLTAGLSLEAVRLAVLGTPAPGRASDSAPTAVLIDARRVMKRPVLGVEIEIPGARYAGPTVYYRDRARAAADPRSGARVLELRATKMAGARLIAAAKSPGRSSAKTAEAIEAAAKAGALVIVVIGKKQ